MNFDDYKSVNLTNNFFLNLSLEIFENLNIFYYFNFSNVADKTYFYFQSLPNLPDYSTELKHKMEIFHNSTLVKIYFLFLSIELLPREDGSKNVQKTMCHVPYLIFRSENVS
jgi:hypothetical protein